MLPSSARLSRVCLHCRLALYRRQAARPVISWAWEERRHQLRSYATGPHRTDKATIEALIRSSGHNNEENIYVSSTDKAKDDVRDQSTRTTATEDAATDDTEPDILVDDITDSHNKNPFGNDVSSENPFGRPRIPDNRKTFKHDLLSHQDLGVDSLGKRVEALIIKNPNKLKASKRATTLISEESEIPATDLRWQDVMPKSDPEGDDATAEVMANLEELRPADTDTISHQEYDTRMTTLVDGFTSSQLVWYISQNQDALQRVDDTPAYPCVLRQSRWESATKDPWDKMKPKQQLATTIMRSIWKLYKQDEVEGFGRVRVWLPSDTLRLLAQSGRSTLVSIRDDFLDPLSGEKLSIALDDDRLTIYSKRSSVNPILERVQSYAEDVAFRHIPVEGIKEDQLQQHVLKELEKITDTVIQYDKKAQKMTVSWKATTDAPIPNDNVARVTPEDPGEIVWRLLVEKPDSSLNNNVQIIEPGKKSMSTFVEHHRELRSMSWRDKLRQWARLVQPLGRKPTSSQPMKLASKVRIPPAAPKVAAHGGDTVLTADFGHILHLKKDLKQARAPSNRRILSPITPHPAGLTSITTKVEDAPIIQHTAIVLNFSPASYFQAEPDFVLPEVRLRLPIDPGTDFSNFMFPQDSTLYTITPSYSNDILLPGESVDVRLTQHQLYALDMKQQSLWDFISRSKFALLEGYLKTPHKASFTMPGHCVSGQVTSDSLEDVPYMFMGLEIHQTTNIEYKGQTLRYNSIEAGQHGGQRQELSLLPGPPSSVNKMAHDDAPHDTESFLNVVEEIATGSVLPWNNGADRMESRSQERFTQDLLDETYEMRLEDGYPEEAVLNEAESNDASFEETKEMR